MPFNTARDAVCPACFKEPKTEIEGAKTKPSHFLLSMDADKTGVYSDETEH
jgi:hypothetical protein